MSVNIEAPTTARGARLLTGAGLTLVALGIIHIVLLTVIEHDITASWFRDGVWAAVPFIDNSPTIDSLSSSRTFWSGIGGFPVPMVLLGALLAHLGRSGTPVPAGLGWALGAWGLVAGLLIGPTPFFLLPFVGAAIVVAARPTPPEGR